MSGRTLEFRRGERVRIVSGSRAGLTGKIDGPHNRTWDYWSVHIDGTDWDAPAFAAPASALRKLDDPHSLTPAA